MGGVAIVQDPEDALARQMPLAALAATQADHVVVLDGMAELLCRLAAGEAALARNVEP